MVKLFCKYLMLTLSSLCALSASVDADFKADRETTLDEAFENSDDMDRKLKDQVRGLKKGENSFINRECASSFANYKDIALNVIEGLCEVGGTTVVLAALGKDAGKSNGAAFLGGLIGFVVSLPIFVTAKIRAIKKILREKKLMKALYQLSVIRDTSTDAHQTRRNELAKDTGASSIF